MFFKIESIENETFGVEMLPAENNKHFNKLTTATELSSRKLAFRYIQEVYTYFLLDIWYQLHLLYVELILRKMHLEF